MGVCAWARVSAAPLHSWLGCAVSVCVFVCALPASTPPFLAGRCGVCVCAWARVSAAARHSWLGCSGLCVFFLWALRLYPATPGWGVLRGCVCLGSGLGFAPPFLAGVLRCACLCARSACTPPLQAGVCGVGVCPWARVSAVSRHSWLGCAVCLCVLGLGFRLRPTTPGWAVGVCVCLCVCSACTPPLLAGVCCVAVCAWARVTASPGHSWQGCSGVCVCVRAPLVPRHSWLGCSSWGCVLGLGSRLHPATPDWGVPR